MPNNDLISRSALLRVLPNDGTNLVYNIRKTVENAPAVDVVPMDFHERCLLLEVQKRHAVERERNAAIEQLKKLDWDLFSGCVSCKHYYFCLNEGCECQACTVAECPCFGCGDQSKWEWNGGQEDEQC